MRRLAVISFFLLLCPSLWGQNTRINLYRVSMDSVVRMMESRGYGEIYFVEDAAKPPRFTFECTILSPLFVWYPIVSSLVLKAICLFALLMA